MESPAQQILWPRLSVFDAWFTAEAVDAICTGDGIEKHQVTNLLSQLVDQALVTVEGQGEEARYRLPETLRQTAHERLVVSGEVDTLKERHAAYYLTLARRAAPKILPGHGPEVTAWLDRLDREHDNLRAVLRWSLERGDALRGLRLAAVLIDFWEYRHVREGREWLTALLALPGAAGRTAVRAHALDVTAGLAEIEGDQAAARALWEEGLAIYRELGTKGEIAHLGIHLAAVLLSQGQFTAAHSLAEESLQISRELGNKGRMARALRILGLVALLSQGDFAVARSRFEEQLAIWRGGGRRREIANSLAYMGAVMYRQGDAVAARSHFEESLAIRRELGDKRGIAASLRGLGNVTQDQGDLAAARALYEESLAMLRDSGDKRGIAECLEGLARLAGRQGEPERAVRLFGSAEALRHASDAPLWPVECMGRGTREDAGRRQHLCAGT